MMCMLLYYNHVMLDPEKYAFTDSHVPLCNLHTKLAIIMLIDNDYTLLWNSYDNSW